MNFFKNVFFVSPQDIGLELLLVWFMLAISVLLVAIFTERLLALSWFRLSIVSAHKVVRAAREGTIEEAHELSLTMKGPAAAVLRAGLDRAVGERRGDPERAMLRELRRAGAAIRARTWILSTSGALMPFVGLFGTVVGVMAAFEAIGESGQGGFAIVSVGISHALIATAVGIAVALEGVVLFNLLSNLAGNFTRELAMLTDELVELIEAEEAEDEGHSAAG